MDAVGGDDGIGLGAHASVDDVERPRRGPPLVDLDEAVAEAELVGAEPVDERVEQDCWSTPRWIESCGHG